MSEIDYDSNGEFYYTNLINSIFLFTLKQNELEKLAAPAFDPIFELESEIDYAYTPVLFETIFRYKLIDISLKNQLLEFKKMTDAIPADIWDWDFLDVHPIWISVREEAGKLLNRLQITNWTYKA